MNRAKFVGAQSHGFLLGMVWNLRVNLDGRGSCLTTRGGLLQFQPEEAMSNLTSVIMELRQERNAAQKRVEQLDQALAALGRLDGSRSPVRGSRKLETKRRTMSPGARKRIAAGQRARWAKWKAARRNK